MCFKDHKSRRIVQIGCLLGMILSACHLQAAFNVKLSGTMPAFGDASSFRISPDGRYVVYLADQNTDEVFELYSVFLQGGVPKRLHPFLSVGKSVDSFEISPDSKRVVYLADQDIDGVNELFSVPINGPSTAGIKLNPALVLGRNVDTFQISPSGSRVVYRADQETNDVFELYSVKTVGLADTGIKLNPDLVLGKNVEHTFQISPDSRRVVYPADQEKNGLIELYSVSIAGPAAAGIKLNPALVSGGNVGITFQISPDSSRVIYRADQETDQVFELYSVPIAGPGGTGIKLNLPLVAGREVRGGGIISPDSRWVVYTADRATDETFELYSVPIAGPAAETIKLNPSLIPGMNIYGPKISPDSSRVVYLAYQDNADIRELYSVWIRGPAAAGVKLNPALVNQSAGRFQISPNSRQVAYKISHRFEMELDLLYIVPIEGPAAAGIKLTPALGADEYLDFYEISPDCNRVIYCIHQQGANISDLYSVSIKGPAAASIRLNSIQVAGRYVYSFQISPDSSRIMYIMDQDIDEVYELYMAFDRIVYLPLILKLD